MFNVFLIHLTFQIALGLATYGRSFTLSSANNHGMGVSHSGSGIAGPTLVKEDSYHITKSAKKSITG